MSVLVHFCFNQLPAAHDTLQHRAALRDRRPVVERTHGEEHGLADNQARPQRIGQRAVGIDQHDGARRSRRPIIRRA